MKTLTIIDRMYKLLALTVGLSLFFLAIFSLTGPTWVNLRSPDFQAIYSVSPTPTYQPHTPSLEQIFSDNHLFMNNLPQGRMRTLIATGDIIPARSVNFQATTRHDFTWPYLKTADFLSSGDITFINLESPLIKDCLLANEGMVFCGDERHVQGLRFAGINIASVANNHAVNYGLEGVEYTTKLLSMNDVQVTGRGEVVLKEVRGLRFAFLGYNDVGEAGPGISGTDPTKIAAEIAQAKMQAGIVVVTFHWGVEYTSQPSERQRELAHFAVDSGADLIIGNHPHWIQPVEIYKGKVITYAHGNFVFDQMWSEETREGVVGKYTFLDKQLIDVQFFPVKIEDYGQPYFLESDQKKIILDKMKEESWKLAKQT